MNLLKLSLIVKFSFWYSDAFLSSVLLSGRFDTVTYVTKYVHKSKIVNIILENYIGVGKIKSRT